MAGARTKKRNDSEQARRAQHVRTRQAVTLLAVVVQVAWDLAVRDASESPADETAPAV